MSISSPPSLLAPPIWETALEVPWTVPDSNLSLTHSDSTCVASSGNLTDSSVGPGKVSVVMMSVSVSGVPAPCCSLLHPEDHSRVGLCLLVRVAL